MAVELIFGRAGGAASAAATLREALQENCRHSKGKLQAKQTLSIDRRPMNIFGQLQNSSI
jgi:hypothetical protein